MAENSLKGKIRGDMNAARRQQDRDRARLLSTLLADVHNREIEVGHELSDPEVIEVLARAVKLRNEAADQMSSRPELAAKERGEIETIREYLPAQLSEDEIRRQVVQAIEAGAADIGAVMGRVMPGLKGRAEGREVNRIARQELEARRSGD